MWIVFAFGSALFAGLTAVLAKCGIKKTDSDVATAVRTVIVLIFTSLRNSKDKQPPASLGLAYFREER